MNAEHVTWPLIRFGVIKEAWRLYKQHAFVWSLATLIVMAAFGVVNGALLAVFGRGEPLGPGGFRLFLPATGAVRFIASTMVNGFFLGGMVRMAGRQIRGGAPRFEDLFSITDCWFDLLLVSFLIGVAHLDRIFVVRSAWLPRVRSLDAGHSSGRRGPAAGDWRNHPELERAQVAMAHGRSFSLGALHPGRFRTVPLFLRRVSDRPALFLVGHASLPAASSTGARFPRGKNRRTRSRKFDEVFGLTLGAASYGLAPIVPHFSPLTKGGLGGFRGQKRGENQSSAALRECDPP